MSLAPEINLRIEIRSFDIHKTELHSSLGGRVPIGLVAAGPRHGHTDDRSQRFEGGAGAK